MRGAHAPGGRTLESHGRSTLGETPLYPRSHYVRELRPALSPRVFALARSRLAFIPGARRRDRRRDARDRARLGAVAGRAAAVAGDRRELRRPDVRRATRCCTAPSCAAALRSTSSAGSASCRSCSRRACGWRGTTASTTRTRTSATIRTYPTLEDTGHRRGARFSVDAFSLGGRRWRGALSLILGFTVQSAHLLLLARERTSCRRASTAARSSRPRSASRCGRRSRLSSASCRSCSCTCCRCSSRTWRDGVHPDEPQPQPARRDRRSADQRAERDAAARARVADARFGFHVEHHLFPAMSTRHAPAVRAACAARWPERYQSMPLGEALRRLHRTARVYIDATTLIDPNTGPRPDADAAPAAAPSRCRRPRRCCSPARSPPEHPPRCGAVRSDQSCHADFRCGQSPRG